MTLGRVGGGICGCLLDCSLEEFPGRLDYPGVDMVEWRLDGFAARFAKDRPGPFFRALAGPFRHPLIVTNRPAREMGSFDGPEEARLEMLEEAAASGAEWVDIEHDVAEATAARFRGRGAKVLASCHSPAETPSRKDLRARLEKMCAIGADALKIATFARCDEDNLRVLELIPLARAEFGVDLIAFCMGPAGKWSRFACLLLGSPWTYARLPGQPAAAPGQLNAEEIRTVLDIVERI
ncbi:MAG: type I 3-dehydroquinate dehydratase [Syntrophobacteraceae bacterium]